MTSYPVNVSISHLPTFQVAAIRVQDVITHEWFNWDGGEWDVYPDVTGAGMVYVAFWAVNSGEELASVTLQVVELDTGKVLATKGHKVAVGDGIGIEWSGVMPEGAYNIKCVVKPRAVTPCILVTVTCDTPTLEVYRNFRDRCLPVVLAKAYYKVGKRLVPIAKRLNFPLKLVFTKIVRLHLWARRRNR